MEYIIGGITIVNDIDYNDPNKQNKIGVLGGVVYAMSGVKLYTDNVICVTAAGPDFASLYGEYYARNGLSSDGIAFTMPHTHHSVLRYGADGSWNEASIHGEDYFDRMRATTAIRASWLAPFCSRETKAIYLDCALEPIFEELGAVRKAAPNALIFWEIPTFVSTDRAGHTAARAVLEQVDWYSVNLKEAAVFFDKQGEYKIVEAVKQFGKPCFLRAGKKGAYLIDSRGVEFLAPIDPGPFADATGCGNSSTAAAMYAIAEGKTPREVLAYANTAAGYNAMYDGPIPHFTPALRQQSLTLVKQYSK